MTDRWTSSGSVLFASRCVISAVEVHAVQHAQMGRRMSRGGNDGAISPEETSNRYHVGTSQARLRVEQLKHKQEKGIRWAADYEL
jgi:hypothetical protein